MTAERSVMKGAELGSGFNPSTKLVTSDPPG